MFQYNAMDKSPLVSGIHVPDILGDLLPWPMQEKAHGLVGLDMDTGCVEVILSPLKKTHMKFGKYLRKVGFDLAECRDYSSKLRAVVLEHKGAELKLTEDGDEAFRVYEDGPSSCMTGMECVRVYATDDVAVAYVEINGRILARAVVCKNEDIGLQHLTIYGNFDLMKPLLEKAGYESGSLEGCTLDKLTDPQGLIYTPFLDCGNSMDDHGSYLEVSCHGSMTGDSTSGVSGEMCGECNEVCDSEEVRYSEYEDASMCESCYDSVHVYLSDDVYHINDDGICKHEDTDEYMLKTDATYVESIDGWLHDEEVTWSEYSQEDYRTSDIVNAITNINYREGEDCCKDDCQEIEGRWIHDDIAVEYEAQLTLDLGE